MQQNRDSVKVAIRHNRLRALYYSVCSLGGIPNLLQIRLLPGQNKKCILSFDPCFEYYIHNSYVTRHFIKMTAFFSVIIFDSKYFKLGFRRCYPLILTKRHNCFSFGVKKEQKKNKITIDFFHKSLDKFFVTYYNYIM